MKYFSLIPLATGIAAKGFNNIPLGGAETWGYLSWQSESNILLISKNNPDNADCAYLSPPTGFVNKDGPYAVNNYEAITYPDFVACDYMFGDDVESLYALNSYEALGNSCVSVTKIEEANVAAALSQEFSSVAIADGDLNNRFAYGNYVCGTLTKNQLSVAEEESFVVYRSWDRESYALHYKGGFSGEYAFTTYSSNDCDNDKVIEEYDGTQMYQEMWYRFGTLDTQPNEKVKAIDVEGTCYQLRTMDWQKSAKKVYMDGNGNGKSFDMWFAQDNPFVPTEFNFDYSRDIREFDDAAAAEGSVPGKYHIHVNNIGASNTDCAPTGGHFNPYGLTSPFAVETQTNHDYETGDLSLRFGDLIGSDSFSVNAMDWNLPLFGVNAINGDMSITFHAYDGSRLVCYNLAEAQRVPKRVQRVN